MPKRFWRTRGYKKFDTIVDLTVPLGSLTETQVQALLKCFAAKEGLSYDEVLGAYVRRNAKEAHEILHVQKNGPYPEYYCGNDPSFVAIVVNERGNEYLIPNCRFPKAKEGAHSFGRAPYSGHLMSVQTTPSNTS